MRRCQTIRSTTGNKNARTLPGVRALLATETRMPDDLITVVFNHLAEHRARHLRGAFYQPREVVGDTSCSRSSPPSRADDEVRDSFQPMWRRIISAERDLRLTWSLPAYFGAVPCVARSKPRRRTCWRPARCRCRPLRRRARRTRSQPFTELPTFELAALQAAPITDIEFRFSQLLVRASNSWATGGCVRV
jgi:hypothetical protein